MHPNPPIPLGCVKFPSPPKTPEPTQPLDSQSILADGLYGLGEFLIGVCNQHHLVAYDDGPHLVGSSPEPTPVMWSKDASVVLGVAFVKILRDTKIVPEKKIEALLKYLGDVRRQVQLQQTQIVETP